MLEAATKRKGLLMTLATTTIWIVVKGVVAHLELMMLLALAGVLEAELVMARGVRVIPPFPRLQTIVRFR